MSHKDALMFTQAAPRAETPARCAAFATDAPDARPSTPRRVFDAFPFFDEADVLALRLHELDDAADRAAFQSERRVDAAATTWIVGKSA